MAHPRKRIELGQPLRDWLVRAIPSAIRLLPITPEIALRAYDFTDFHGDPADRVIAATAIVNGLTLVTSDRFLIDRPEVPDPFHPLTSTPAGIAWSTVLN